MGKSLFGRHVGTYTDDMLPAVEMMLNKRVGIKVNPVRVRQLGPHQALGVLSMDVGSRGPRMS